MIRAADGPEGRAAVGDDVVDLASPEAVGVSRRDRFVRRILRPDELCRAAEAADPDLAIWAIFAAKEAGYKAAAGLFGHAPSM
ncbi:MAG TPA: 4'-phosphopantetheinyl transferase superfamily protein, partial [Vulgatibacter sp.]